MSRRTGMVFVSFPAADVAADAVDKLKSSTLDSKELFIKVLPNIHVSINSSSYQDQNRQKV